MQNVSQVFKFKVAKFHFIILCHFGVIKEKPQVGGGNPGIDSVKLEKRKCLVLLSTILNSWKYIKLVINLIHNSYRESSLYTKCSCKYY